MLLPEGLVNAVIHIAAAAVGGGDGDGKLQVRIVAIVVDDADKVTFNVIDTEADGEPNPTSISVDDALEGLAILAVESGSRTEADAASVVIQEVATKGAVLDAFVSVYAEADKFNKLVDEVGNMDSGELESLFDAPAVVDSVTSQANPDAVAPPSGPPTRSEDDHVVLSIIIICVVLVPVAVFLLYLWMDRTKPLPQAATTKAPRSPRPSKPYRPVNTNEDLSSRPASQVRFKIEF